MATAPFRMEPEGLSDGLWAIALATAGAYEVRFAQNCEQLTEAFVRGGADMLKLQGKTDQADAISQAVHNTVRYVEFMITDARTGTTPSELHEYNFSAAQSHFCPCFPFC
jgi:hypothetical protein